MSAFLLSGALASGNGAAHSRQRWLPFHLLHLFDFFSPLGLCLCFEFSSLEADQVRG